MMLYKLCYYVIALLDRDEMGAEQAHRLGSEAAAQGPVVGRAAVLICSYLFLILSYDIIMVVLRMI